jgi:hypothetical protein
VTFESTYDNGSVDIGTSVIEVNGGYLMCGTTLDDINGDFDVFITKVDFQGNEIWSNVYSDIGAGDDYATYVTSTSDGNYIITGITEDVEFGDDDVFVLKFTAEGTELWVEDYDGNAAEDDIANYITELSDGDLLICGSSEDGDNMDMWLFEITPSGEFVGENFYGLNGNDEANCVVELDDGSVILVGNSYDEINEDMDGVLIKIDAFGDEEWAYYTSGLVDEEFNDVIVDENEDFLIVGAQEDEVNEDLDILLEKVSNDGSTVLFSYTFDYNGGDDEAYRVYVNPENECFIVGEVEDTNNDDSDAYIASVDTDLGNITGEVLYGDIFDDVFFDFDFTSDNGFICVGSTEINEAGDSDVYLVKTDEDGYTSIDEEFSNSNSFVLYPNPVQDVLNIYNSKNNYSNYSIENSNGQIVQRGIFQNSINVSNLKEGMYFIILTADKNIITKKFIKIN